MRCPEKLQRTGRKLLIDKSAACVYNSRVKMKTLDTIMVKSIAASTVTLSYALAIFYLSFVNAGTLGLIYKRIGITGGVSLLHVLSFALLAFLIRFMFSTRLYKTRIQDSRTWSVYTAVILAGIIEILQVFMPTRHARTRDLLLHAAGIFVFFIIDRGIDQYVKWRECD
jgi:hypothetical protein